MSPPEKPRRAERPRRFPTKEQVAGIDYRNPDGLARFLSSRGRIKSRGQTGLSRKDQSRLAREVKRARELGLLAYSREGDGKEERDRRTPRSGERTATS